MHANIIFKITNQRFCFIICVKMFFSGWGMGGQQGGYGARPTWETFYDEQGTP